MKNLILIRHSKSSWKEANVTDSKRPLNKRGRRDAPFMGKLLKKMKVNPDLVLSSSALRASETARLICDELDVPEGKLKFDDDIYEASHEELIEVLNSVDSSVNKLFLVGHNPGLTDLSNFISDSQIINIPTTGIVSLTFMGDKWSKLTGNSCTFNFFEYPKKYYPLDDK